MDIRLFGFIQFMRQRLESHHHFDNSNDAEQPSRPVMLMLTFTCRMSWQTVGSVNLFRLYLFVYSSREHRVEMKQSLSGRRRLRRRDSSSLFMFKRSPL